MKRSSSLTIQLFALIILNDLIDTIAQVCMKKGLSDSSVVLVGLGVIIFALGFFIWISVLYKTDLSIAMPLGSISYILVPLSAMLFLHEHVSLLRWIGIACIVAGIYFVSQSTATKHKQIRA